MDAKFCLSVRKHPNFVTSNGFSEIPANKLKVKQLIQEQVAVIKRAKEASIPIIFVELRERYFGFSLGRSTIDTLTAAAANYEDVKIY